MNMILSIYGKYIFLLYSEAEKVMVSNLRFKDAQEGISAFKEKRHPTWDHTTDKAH